jgi:uncharacterized protein YndB with AHSA1/START domain
MSNDHALRHDINIAAGKPKVHAALTTADGLRGWNTADVTGVGEVGSEWQFGYGARPKFSWRVVSNDHGWIVWACTAGPGDSVGTTVEFALTPLPDGRTKLALVHAGWPHQEGNFNKCNTLWGVLLHHLRVFAESGKSSPAYS